MFMTISPARKSGCLPAPVRGLVLANRRSARPPTAWDVQFPRMFTSMNNTAYNVDELSLPSLTAGSISQKPPEGDALIATEIATEMRRNNCIAAHADRIKTFWPEPSPSARKNFPTFCNMYSTIKATAKPNYLEARIPIDSDLVISAWRQELAGYHDHLLCDYLEFGWPLGYHADAFPQSTDKNHPSGEAFLPHISEFIDIELHHRAVLGPFQQDPFQPWVRYSPIMTCPKRNSELTLLTTGSRLTITSVRIYLIHSQQLQTLPIV